MKKNVRKKILISSILIICLFSIFIPQSNAGKLSEIVSGAQGFLGQGSEDVPLEIENMSDVIYNILFIIGIVVMVIIGMGIGIKFMTGGIEEKAKVKETLIPYIAGCVVILGAFTIWKIVVTILQSAQ